MKILHVLYQSLPNSKGSSIRSRDIMAAQSQSGLTPIVISSPFQQGWGVDAVESFSGVRYYRTYNARPEQVVSESRRSIFQKILKLLQIFEFSWRVYRVAKSERVSVIHAHAMFFCGFSGWAASRVLGIPFVYELRSLWEERPNQTAKFLDKIVARCARFLETCVMRMADRVVVINKNLYKEVVARGIAVSKVAIVENAVDIFRVDSYDNECTQRTGNDLVIGYVGSVSPIEGLDLLLDAIYRLQQRGCSNPFVIYGDGPALADLKGRAHHLHLKNVSFKGAFSPEDVADVYKEIDIVVNPRKRSHLTDAVTPLKPLEAMAFRKLVVVSNIGGMTELVEDEQTGFLFEADNVVSLADTLFNVINSYQAQSGVISKGRVYVESQRSWLSNGKRYADIYRALVS
ncbi:MAG: glycosyltransferase family 4 protein [Moraxellaceae bacterium]|nr:glycosyltransferase family 4 protein [Moraxellaceae bacterium]